MTKEQFEKQYAQNSDISLEEYHAIFVTSPCDCGEEDCGGWVAEYKRSDFPSRLK